MEKPKKVGTPTVFGLAWHRYSIIMSVVSDASARIISTLFYFTVVVPFGIASRLFSDALDRNGTATWHDREPVPTDVESARLQG
ncbi:MAG: hypothetical protein KC546_16490 [Anaerolineae bacterium]|nr:hypothetical protein [Anaerolineae bacterium]MCA9889981.1 hypothetical protein [Anaerolineae bacterium]MCA9892139.1 hypothetical protein [Anaerolineae bacterium]MCB9459998.1 hypothetical protein [Anaerolineaceae bacterium]